MSSHMTASSVITLTGDLVTEHPVGTKIAYSILYLIHIISSFVICFVFVSDFYQNLIEFCSIVGVIVASWIATSIANLVLYQTIRPRGRYTGPENAPGSQVTAGICLRLLFTMLPFSPVLRYIEAWRANRLLAGLEAQITRRPNGSLAPGEEKILRAVQRTRRECRRRDKAAGLLSLFNACISAGTMLVLLLYFFAHRLSYGLPPYSSIETACLLVCVVGSGLWLATAMLHFYPAQRNSTVTAEHSTSPEGRLCGLLMLFMWHFFMVAARAAALALFAVIFGAVLFAVIPVHMIFCMLLLYMTRCFGNDDDARRCSLSIFLRDLFHALVGVYDFVNANQGRTRLRYLLFYTLMLAENGAFVGVWYARKRADEGLSRLPIFMAVVIADIVGLVIMQLYYFLFFPETDNPGLLSFCNEPESTEKNDSNFADVRMDPQVAYKLKSSQMWVERQNFYDASSVHTDVIPPSDDVEFSRGTSVVNFQLSGSREHPRTSHPADPRIPRSSRPPSSMDSESFTGYRPPSIIRDARFRNPPDSHAASDHARRGPSVSGYSGDLERPQKQSCIDTRLPNRNPRIPASAVSPSADFDAEPGRPYRDYRDPHAQGNARQASVESDVGRSREKLDMGRDPRVPYRDPRVPRNARQSSVDSDVGRSREKLDPRVPYRDPRIPGNARQSSVESDVGRSREKLDTGPDPRLPYRDPRVPGNARQRSVDADVGRSREKLNAGRDPTIGNRNHSGRMSGSGPPLMPAQNRNRNPSSFAASQSGAKVQQASVANEDEDDDSFSFASSSSSSIGISTK